MGSVCNLSLHWNLRVGDSRANDRGLAGNDLRLNCRSLVGCLDSYWTCGLNNLGLNWGLLNDIAAHYVYCAFDSLACSHWLIKAVFEPFILGLILHFFFLSLLWSEVSLSFVRNFGVVFNLVVNYLIFGNVFIDWDSDSLLQLVVFSDYLLVGNSLKFAFSLKHLTIFGSHLRALKKNSLLDWVNIRLCAGDNSLNHDWLSFHRWRASANHLCCGGYNWRGSCYVLSLDWSLRNHLLVGDVACLNRSCNNRCCNHWLLRLNYRSSVFNGGSGDCLSKSGDFRSGQNLILYDWWLNT